jgi:hypothetical protein
MVDQNEQVCFTRPEALAKQIVILDGISGTGKTMFTPILSSFERMQNARFEYMVEYLCISKKYGKLSKDGTSVLLNLLADSKFYDGMISREVNFRPNDLSSVFYSSNIMQYLRQLWMNDGKEVEDRIEKENPILLLTTHQLFDCLEAIYESFNGRVKVIETIRHPVYLLDHWSTYIEMFGKNSRDFTVWADHFGVSVPWFAIGWEEKYINTKKEDKVIYTIDSLMNKIICSSSSKNEKKDVMLIPFEKFVLEPEHIMIELESFLNTNMTRSTKRIMKKQNVPRKSINDGPYKSIYGRYGVSKYSNSLSHKDDMDFKLEKTKSNTSIEAFSVLENIAGKYEEMFGIWY